MLRGNHTVLNRTQYFSRVMHWKTASSWLKSRECGGCYSIITASAMFQSEKMYSLSFHSRSSLNASLTADEICPFLPVLVPDENSTFPSSDMSSIYILFNTPSWQYLVGYVIHALPEQAKSWSNMPSSFCFERCISFFLTTVYLMSFTSA